MMGITGVSSSIASQGAWSRQIQLRHRCTHRSQNYLACHQELQMKLFTLPRLSCSVKRRISIKRLGFGAVESRPFNSDKGRLGLVSSRTAVARAQEENNEQQELDKEKIKSSDCKDSPRNVLLNIPRVEQTSRSQRANMVSKIFMAAFVWISLFFAISVGNNEMGGGSSGRRRPRK